MTHKFLIWEMLVKLNKAFTPMNVCNIDVMTLRKLRRSIRPKIPQKIANNNACSIFML